MRTAVVTGITGVVGRRLGETLVASGDFEQIVGLSRRASDGPPGITMISADLQDADACRAVFSGLRDVTHVYNAARFDHSTERPEPVDVNTAIVAHVLDAALETGQKLEHIHLVQGSKYYGSQLGAYPTPAREDDHRALQRNFYYDQEDLAIDYGARHGFTWSASRPHGVCDPDLRIARSMSLLIAVYATINRRLGLPLCFPGTPQNFHAVYQCTDAGLLARAIHWMSTTPACRNQAFNVTNGDLIRWEREWPIFARFFEMETGPVRTISLAQTMPQMEEIWDSLAREHGLATRPYSDLVVWSYGDFLFRPAWDIMSDTSKLRRFGFYETIDTRAMFLKLFNHFRGSRIIP
ncbi:SDR family oxidoreductase [Lutibaculum baratangense]|uniref:SDR family oxidoreductase n=1 Tax=Lutibaculum baratangense TaxID=1358440 RepID=UPI00058C549B|nr:SDR family oxidoreductase [Lutibaculum baratangense]